MTVLILPRLLNLPSPSLAVGINLSRHDVRTFETCFLLLAPALHVSTQHERRGSPWRLQQTANLKYEHLLHFLSGLAGISRPGTATGLTECEKGELLFGRVTTAGGQLQSYPVLLTLSNRSVARQPPACHTPRMRPISAPRVGPFPGQGFVMVLQLLSFFTRAQWVDCGAPLV